MCARLRLVVERADDLREHLETVVHFADSAEFVHACATKTNEFVHSVHSLCSRFTFVSNRTVIDAHLSKTNQLYIFSPISFNGQAKHGCFFSRYDYLKIKARLLQLMNERQRAYRASERARERERERQTIKNTS
jgi:hypothetical protein